MTATSPFAATPVGVPGAEATAPALRDLAVDDAPPPAEFVAATVTEYDVPAVRPVSLQELFGTVAVQATDVAPVAVAVAVYDATAAPPSDSGASHDTFISVRLARATATFFGALGTQLDAHEYSNLLGELVALPTRDCSVTAFDVALARMREVISLGVALGVCCKSIAATPTTNGVAIDVPVLL